MPVVAEIEIWIESGTAAVAEEEVVVEVVVEGVVVEEMGQVEGTLQILH